MCVHVCERVCECMSMCVTKSPKRKLPFGQFRLSLSFSHYGLACAVLGRCVCVCVYVCVCVCECGCV